METPIWRMMNLKRSVLNDYQQLRNDRRREAPIKAWTKGVPVEDKACQQLVNLANMPFIHKHVAVMPY